jgi:hypothetical protein
LSADVARRYVELAFRLGKHEPELVENYYGPAEVAAPIEAENPLEPARLAGEARSLLEELERGELETQRRTWLEGQTRALLTIARRLAGESFSYADEVEGTFGVRPRWYHEAGFEQARDLLDEALPGPGDVPARFARWFERTALPADKLLPAVESITAELRARTHDLVGLPEGESVELELVSRKWWSGFNRNLGGLRSRISINTDLPISAGGLAYFLAHEAYPGHHVDGAWKEQVLVRERGQLEETMTVYAAPEAVLAEGVAELGAELILDDDGGEDLVARHLRPLGLEHDAEVGAKVFAARKLLRKVPPNLALLLYERGASVDEARDYARRWSLQSEARIDRMVGSVHQRPFPGYSICYPEGLRLCDAFVRGEPGRFKRLLTEQLVPVELEAAS